MAANDNGNGDGFFQSYILKTIVGMRLNNGIVEYLVKGETENTWETEESVDCPHGIADFYEQRNREEAKRKENEHSGSSSEESSSEESSEEEITDYTRNLIPDRIVGFKLANGILVFLVTCKDSVDLFWVPAVFAKMKYPQMVIAFYMEQVVMYFKSMPDAA